MNLKPIQHKKGERHRCVFCGDTEDHITRHHLIPQQYIKRLMTRPKSRKMLKECSYDYKRKVPSCRSCHTAIHQIFENKELAEQYYTEELLLAHEEFSGYIAWKRKKLGVPL